MVFLVTYELRTLDMDYTKLYSFLEKDMGKSAIHVLRDSWWVELEGKPVITQLCDQVRSFMGEKDVLFIIDITDQATNGWLASSSWKWLQERSKI
ncbi:hypothetical protein EZS27_022151 [termite gut metagenome]|uniref:Uncharacterized protein n=1 Tax=termite gut metagenome TaxID=433724 RepID=A0A5J4R7C0_9ZZZZ